MFDGLPMLSVRHYAFMFSVLAHIVLLVGWGSSSSEAVVTDGGTPSLPLALHFSLHSRQVSQTREMKKQNKNQNKPFTDTYPGNAVPALVKATAAIPDKKTDRIPVEEPDINQQAAPEQQPEQTGVKQQAAVIKQSETVGMQSIPVVKTVSYRYPPEPPVYPRLALKRKQQGEAIIHARVNTEGETEQLQLVHSSGFRLLDQSALDAVSGWDFMPALQNGDPVTAWIEVPVKFEIH